MAEDNTKVETISTTPIEFINYGCEIKEEFDDYLRRQHFDDVGFDYNVLTILGCQSSGKSHFLNALFGLEFQVMDTKQGHSQTTKGLWATLVKPSDPLTGGNSTLVIDVEGTDSRERGDDRLTFEHRSSLLCLALSDCVIINLWYNSLGNLTGSNYGLLKTVIEANLELANNIEENSEFRTILFFCVRDWFPGLASLETIRNKIVNEYMASIWGDISKPEKFKDSELDEIFQIEIYGLSNAITDPEKFERDVEEIRCLWYEKIRPKTYSRRIPSDGFFVYASNLWKTIKEQNHLDIPTQREMLANLRCREISAAVLKSKHEPIADIVSESQMKIIPDFKEQVELLISDAIGDYILQASRYHKKTCFDVAEGLIVSLCREFQPVFDANSALFCKDLVLKVSLRMEETFAVSGKGSHLKIGNLKATDMWSCFSEKCDEILQISREELQCFMQSYDLKFEYTEDLPVNFTFDTQAALDHFSASVRAEIDLKRFRHLELLKGQIMEVGNAGFEVVESLLMERNLTSDKYWGAVNQLIEQGYEKALAMYKDSYKGLMGHSILENEFEYLCLMLLLQGTKTNLERVEANVAEKIVARFEAFFHYQDYKGEQIPIEWGKVTEEFLKSAYAESKKEALSVVTVLRDCQPPRLNIPAFDIGLIKADHLLYRSFFNDVVQDISTTQSSLSEDVMVNTMAICKKRFHELFRNAQAIQSSSSSGVCWRNVPPMFWLLLLIFGWNEIFAVFRVILKVQIIIPLIIILFIALQYFSVSIFGQDFERVVDPLRRTVTHIVAVTVTWTIRRVYMLLGNRGLYQKHSKKHK